MAQGKAHCYHIWPNEGNSEQILQCLKKASRATSPIRFNHGNQQVAVGEQRMRTVGEEAVYTASMFRVRDGGFPSVVDSVSVRKLELPSHEGLGEPTCIAYDPIMGRVVLLSSQNGPKHGALRPFLKEIGFPHEITIEPVLRQDMTERLERTRFVQSLNFKINDTPASRELAEAGAPVARALDLADSVQGTDISVSVSIGRRKEGLALAVVKQAARHLVEVGDTHLRKLVLVGADDDDAKCHHLDLLKARVEITVELIHNSREIDRADCQKQLVRVLKEALPAIDKRARSV